MGVIELKQISRVYGFGDATTIALDDVDLTVEKGEFLAIMGPSGSGKSTLLNIIGLLDTPTSGHYKLDDEPVAGLGGNARAQIRRQRIGFVFQNFNLLPRMTVIDNVALPLMYAGQPVTQRLEKASELLKKLGLGDREYYYPNQLSGGQSQRVAVARALANDPAIILADEPTGNLDSANSQNIMELLAELNKAGNTLVMVTHEPDVASYAHRVIHMEDGRIVSSKQNRSTPATVKKTKKSIKVKSRKTSTKKKTVSRKRGK